MDLTDHHSQNWREFVAKHGRLGRNRPALVHLVQGLLLSMGAPLGWFLLLKITGAELDHVFVEHWPLYVYLFCSTALVFSLFGWLLGRKEAQLNALIDRLDHETITDPLTGLYNRRYFFNRLDELCERLARRDRPFSLAIVDLDRFKDVNDRYGHLAGDRVLRSVAQILSTHVRRSELIGRIGGEEFGLLFPEGDETESLEAVNRLLQAIEDCAVGFAKLPESTPITASAGVANTLRLVDMPDPTHVMSAADSALYRAKDLGRNQAVLWIGARTATCRPDPREAERTRSLHKYCTRCVGQAAPVSIIKAG